MSELKNCPFCGGDDLTFGVGHVNSVKKEEGEYIKQGSIECKSCNTRKGSSGTLYRCKDVDQANNLAVNEIIKEWNTRANGWISVDDFASLPDGNFQAWHVLHKCSITVAKFGDNWLIEKTRSNQWPIEAFTHYMAVCEPPCAN